MRSNFLLPLLGLSVVLLSGCAPSLYVPTARSEAPGYTLHDLSAGRQLYVEKCGSCHALHPPDQYPEAAWRQNLEKMQPRAHITGGERELILKYLLQGIARQGARN